MIVSHAHARDGPARQTAIGAVLRWSPIAPVGQADVTIAAADKNPRFGTMKNDLIVDGEAMAEIEGNDVTHLLGARLIVDLHQEPQRAAFNAYRVAFHDNATDPNLKHAAALVCAWNLFADIMGIDRV